MPLVDQRIIDFLFNHHVFSLATSKDNNSYSASCYYAYNHIDNSLIFSSDLKTTHAKQFIENPKVSATIAVETDDIMKIQGLQILGIVHALNQEKLKLSLRVYLERFPYAKNFPLKLWSLKLNFIKMTDNSLGFGKKIIWIDN